MSIRLSTTAIAVALSSAFQPTIANAADSADPNVMAAVVVVATRQPARADQLLSDVSVITRQDIEQAGQMTIEELLARQPGIEFSANGGPGTNSSVFVRGANANQTLLFVDGLRVGSATNGTPTLARIPLWQVERIEILRGPASSLYGADAIGGVIQIFTRKGEGSPRLSATVGYGTYNTTEAGAALGGGTETISYNVAAGHFQTDGFSAIRNAANSSFNPDRDGYRNLNFSGNIAFRPAQGHEIAANVMTSNGTSRYDSSPKSRDYKNEQDVSIVGLTSRNRISDAWVSTLRLGQTIDDSTSRTDGIAGSVFRTRQDQLIWQNDLRLPVGRALVAAESLTQRVDSTTTYAMTERSIRSLMAGWNAGMEAHRVQVNLRHDDNSQFGAKTTGFAGYGYRFAPEWRGHVSYGTAFRAPTFNELYFPNSGYGGGNPSLKPETARNGEAGLDWESGAQRLSLTYFHNRVQNLINGWPPVNVSRATLSGTTLAYVGSISDWALSAAVDLMRPRDDDTGRRLARRADEQFKASATRAVGPWRYGIEWQLVGARYDDAANTKRMGGYGLADLFVDYRIDRDWQLFARANNLFDKRYELVRDYGTPGANLFVGARYAMR